MYLFPTIHVPEKAMAKAAESNMQPDEFYCMELLEATGIVCALPWPECSPCMIQTVVPGTGFKQEANTWHFRTTFLPAEEDFDDFIRLFKVTIHHPTVPTTSTHALCVDTLLAGLSQHLHG